MKYAVSLLAGMAALGLGGIASADHHAEAEKAELSPMAKQFKMGCEQFQMQNGGNTDCTCLAKEVDANEDFAAEMMSIMGPEDLDGLSDESKEIIASCEMEEDAAM